MEHKFTDDEIIKAMEWCTGGTSDNCRNCPLENEAFCKDAWEEGILDIIKRQQAEIERLQRLLVEQHNSIDEIVKNPKMEAYKEFEEKLRNIVGPIYHSEVRDIFKELTEKLEENNNER